MPRKTKSKTVVSGMEPRDGEPHVAIQHSGRWHSQSGRRSGRHATAFHGWKLPAASKWPRPQAASRCASFFSVVLWMPRAALGLYACHLLDLVHSAALSCCEMLGIWLVRVTLSQSQQILFTEGFFFLGPQTQHSSIISSELIHTILSACGLVICRRLWFRKSLC
jgi:hypothetical protein